MQIPETMKSAAIDRFGGPNEISVHTIPVPQCGPDDVLIRVDTAGVGVWDPWDREGKFAEMTGREPDFPYVLGADGAGTVVAVGDNVTRFREGDRVYAYGELDPRSRFYAEYAVVNEDKVAKIPNGLEMEEAGAMATDAITALCGLEELELKSGETLLIFGASGGVGHFALQLAKRMGVRVFAVASGADGVRLCEELGADACVDGHKGGIAEAAQQFASDGIDTALVTASSENLDEALSCIREGGRVVFPHGVEPKPKAEGLHITGYDGRATPEILDKLNKLIEAGPFHVHVARTYRLERATEAHRALADHYVGKLALKVNTIH